MNTGRRGRYTRVFNHRSKLGAAPGTMTLHPDLATQPVLLKLTAFDENEVVEAAISDPDAIIPYMNKYPVTWISIYGLGNVVLLEKIASIFNLHKLAMEDVVNVHQRPKIEEYDDVIFAVTRMPSIINDELDLEQISIFWGKNFVITFNERNGDCMDPLRLRITDGGKRHKMLHAEYLAYAMIDTIVDSFFPILEIYGFKLDDIEENAVLNPSIHIIVNIHEFKRDLLAVRRAMWSQREALRTLGEVANFSDKEMRFFIRDCEDHTIQLIDILESYRERTSGLMDIYLSSVNNKTNEIMKVLTMIATIFMPIGVVASIYGMNFDRSVSSWNMPELGWRYGYLYAIAIMLTIAITLIFWFRSKGWLRKKDISLHGE